MNLVRKYAALLATLLMLVAVPVRAPIPIAGSYQARITIRGDLTLTGSQGQPTLVLPVDADFSSYVPSIIPIGEYNDVGFHGSATGPNEKSLITCYGLLTFRLPSDKPISLWVKFVAEKPQEEDVPEGVYCVEGFVSVEISGALLPPEEVTWLLMKGNVSEYTDATGGKTSKAFGHLTAHAKIQGDEKWTKVKSVFSTESPPTEETEEFSRSFYIVTLVKVEEVVLDGGLTIRGTWNVQIRTVEVNRVEASETTTTVALTSITEGAMGALRASFTPSKIPAQAEGTFDLEIETFGNVSGDTVFFRSKSAPLPEPGIPLADFDKNGEVSILDLIEIGNAYRAKLGSSTYSLDFDIAPGGQPDSLGEPDLEINVLDLIAAASEHGQEY